MKNLDKVSVSHDKALIRELQDDPELAMAYLQAAMEDKEEPAVLLLALRHIYCTRSQLAPFMRPHPLAPSP